MARAQCSKALCSLIPLSRKRRPVFHLSKQAKACQHVDAHRASRRLLCKCLSCPPTTFKCRFLLSNLAVRRKCLAAHCLWASCESEQQLHVHGHTHDTAGVLICWVMIHQGIRLILSGVFRPHLKTKDTADYTAG